MPTVRCDREEVRRNKMSQNGSVRLIGIIWCFIFYYTSSEAALLWIQLHARREDIQLHIPNLINTTCITLLCKIITDAKIDLPERDNNVKL